MKNTTDTVRLFRSYHWSAKIALLFLLGLGVILIYIGISSVVLLLASWSWYGFGETAYMLMIVIASNIGIYSIFGAHLTLSREGIQSWGANQKLFLPWKSIDRVQFQGNKFLLVILNEPAVVTYSLREGKLQQKAVIKNSLFARLSESDVQQTWVHVDVSGIFHHQGQAIWQEYLQKYGSHIQIIDMSKPGESVVPKANIE